ncbi:MAG: UDP-N-acetylglucosamine 1-carboxyvinyltransferase [Desulfovibrio sp.]|nr:UDP-N-acetylglucosamine 1-carboxyvinyltransferase [Desulfovibrio sp.]
MDKLIIEGGRRLEGSIRISGSKNAALPILFAAILCSGAAVLRNVPKLRDIATTLKLLRSLGCQIEENETEIAVEPKSLSPMAPYDLVCTMRASVLCLGPLLARLGRAKVALPGGCAIGARPVDQHLKAFEKLGARFSLEEGYIVGECDRLEGARVTFDMPTVGGTENALMAATLARGETVLENCAREPEIVDLANFLNACGAKIEGHGESVIHIQGTDELRGATYSVMSDRIEAGTFLVAAGITRGNLTLIDCPYDALEAVISKLKQMGMDIRQTATGETIARTDDRLDCADISTQPYPGFPTDMQAQAMALLCLSRGAAVVEERIFENRFMHVQELLRMGANIRASGRAAVVKGVDKLSGAPVMASDLRASASLALAALAADGVTEISRIYHLDRGYEAIEKKLNAVGASIRRANDKD